MPWWGTPLSRMDREGMTTNGIKTYRKQGDVRRLLGRTFQTEEMASAKALGQGHTWNTWETQRKPVQMERGPRVKEVVVSEGAGPHGHGT